MHYYTNNSKFRQITSKNLNNFLMNHPLEILGTKDVQKA